MHRENIGSNIVMPSLQSEARCGRASAQFALGKHYADLGKDTHHQRRAIRWFRKAADQGHSEAQHQLGLLYQRGPESLCNDDAAFLWLRKAAAQGNSEAVIDLGWFMHLKNENAAKVIHCFRQAIALGNAAGYYSLGNLYDYAMGDKRDKLKALNFYREAARRNYAPAQWHLGCHYSRAYYGQSPVNLSAGVKWLRRAAALGHAGGQYELGKLYEKGRGVSQDLSKATELYQSSASQGDIWAQNALGRIYRVGHGVPQDFAFALKLFHSAAAQDADLWETEVAEALNTLGEMHLFGQGVIQDHPAALQFFRKAAKWSSEACVNLGVMYFEGKRTPVNYPKAIKYFRQAARLGDVTAKDWLSRMKTIRVHPVRPSRKVHALATEGDTRQPQLQFQ